MRTSATRGTKHLECLAAGVHPPTQPAVHCSFPNTSDDVPHLSNRGNYRQHAKKLHKQQVQMENQHLLTFVKCRSFPSLGRSSLRLI